MDLLNELEDELNKKGTSNAIVPMVHKEETRDFNLENDGFYMKTTMVSLIPKIVDCMKDNEDATIIFAQDGVTISAM